MSGQSHIGLVSLLRLMFIVLALSHESDPHSGGTIDPWPEGMAGWLVPRALLSAGT